MLTSFRAAASVKFAGKFATTSTWNGSATSPACALYSSIVANSLRRYFCSTVSMCSVSRVSCSSICRGSVQMRLAIELLVEIGQVHERGEALAQPDRIENREPHFARRHRGEEPQHHRLQHVDRRAAAFFLGGEHHHRMLFERHQRRQRRRPSAADAAARPAECRS